LPIPNSLPLRMKNSTKRGGFKMCRGNAIWKMGITQSWFAYPQVWNIH
jgi:hypothetical protein